MPNNTKTKKATSASWKPAPKVDTVTISKAEIRSIVIQVATELEEFRVAHNEMIKALDIAEDVHERLRNSMRSLEKIGWPGYYPDEPPATLPVQEEYDQIEEMQEPFVIQDELAQQAPQATGQVGTNSTATTLGGLVGDQVSTAELWNQLTVAELPVHWAIANNNAPLQQPQGQQTGQGQQIVGNLGAGSLA